MPDPYIPPNCLADARRVLGVQDRDVARAAEQRWPARMWRAAVKAAADAPRREAA